MLKSTHSVEDHQSGHRQRQRAVPDAHRNRRESQSVCRNLLKPRQHRTDKYDPRHGTRCRDETGGTAVDDRRGHRYRYVGHRREFKKPYGVRQEQVYQDEYEQRNDRQSTHDMDNIDRFWIRGKIRQRKYY